MRTFDVFEKGIISKLKIYYENRIFHNFLTLIDDDLEDKKIVINNIVNTVTLHFDDTIYLPGINLIDEVRTMSLLLAKTIFLLQYLELNGYIFMFNEGSNLNQHSRIISGRNSFQFDITDKTVCKLINDYFSKTIIISQSITDLVNDNFISKEEIRHNENINVANENLRAAKIAVEKAENSIDIAAKSLVKSQKSINLSKLGIGIAIAIGLFSLGISAYSIWDSNQPKIQKVEIDNLQYQKAVKILNSVIDNQTVTKNKLDSISFHLRKNKAKI